MIVLVYGYEGSGEGHWQRRLEDELQESGVAHAFPALPDPLEPDKDRWVAELARCVDRAGDDVTFVAHSLGCWAVDHFVATHGASRLRAALLVAPPSPYLLFEPVQSFLPPPMDRAAWSPIAASSRLVAGDDDDYASVDEHAEIAAALGIAHECVPGGGHLNTDSGYGPWDLPRAWLREVGAL